MQPFTYPEMYRLEEMYFWFVGKHAFIQSALRYINKKTPQILDIGCGTGGTTKFLSKWGKITAVEKNQDAASFAMKRGITVHVSSAERLPFPDNSFDLVTFCDVLYHKGIDEYAALSEAYRVLKKNGVILVTDCASPSIWSKHDQIMDAKYRYTKKQLTTQIQQARFRIIHAQYTFVTIFPLIAISRFFPFFTRASQSLPRLPSKVNEILIYLLKIEAGWFPSHLPCIGSSLIVIASKD